MKICFISPYPPKLGGLSTYSKRTVDSLSRSNSLEVVVIPFNSIKNLFNILSVKTIKPDIVRLEYNLSAYGITSIPIFFIFLFFKLFSGIKFVVNYHEVKREIDLLRFLGPFYYRMYSTIFDHIYVHTKEAKKILENKCRISSQKISVIPLGTFSFTDTNDYGKELKRKYNLSDKPIILYFGFIHTDKGIEYLMEAIRYLETTDPDLAKNIQVIIAGDIRPRSGLFKYFEKKDKEYKNMLKKISKESQAKNTIKFIGFIGEEYIYSLINLAFAVVMPYTKVEQSGVLNMVLPLKKPVIASNIGGLRETLEKVGILVEPKNAVAIAKAISMLVGNKSYYRKISNGYKRLSSDLDVLRVTNMFVESLVNL